MTPDWTRTVTFIDPLRGNLTVPKSMVVGVLENARDPDRSCVHYSDGHSTRARWVEHTPAEALAKIRAPGNS